MSKKSFKFIPCDESSQTFNWTFTDKKSQFKPKFTRSKKGKNNKNL